MRMSRYYFMLIKISEVSYVGCISDKLRDHVSFRIVLHHSVKQSTWRILGWKVLQVCNYYTQGINTSVIKAGIFTVQCQRDIQVSYIWTNCTSSVKKELIWICNSIVHQHIPIFSSLSAWGSILRRLFSKWGMKLSSCYFSRQQRPSWFCNSRHWDALKHFGTRLI